MRRLLDAVGDRRYYWGNGTRPEALPEFDLTIHPVADSVDSVVRSFGSKFGRDRPIGHESIQLGFMSSHKRVDNSRGVGAIGSGDLSDRLTVLDRIYQRRSLDADGVRRDVEADPDVASELEAMHGTGSELGKVLGHGVGLGRGDGAVGYEILEGVPEPVHSLGADDSVRGSGCGRFLSTGEDR